MSLRSDVEVLRNISLFKNVDPAKLKLLAFTSERLTYLDGDVLCSQGEVGDAAFIILEGTADIRVDTAGGEVKVAEVGKSDVVGEIAILCDVPRTASVVATSELTTLRISKDGFFHLVTQFPQVGVEIMGELAHRLNVTTQQLTSARLRLRELESDN